MKRIVKSDSSFAIQGNLYDEFKPYRMRQHESDHTNTVENGGLGNIFSDQKGKTNL